MRLAPVLLALAAAATATPPRGFLLVATNLPVQLLQRDADADWRRDELGCVYAADGPRPLCLSIMAQPPQEARGAQVAADDGVRLPRAAPRTGPAAPAPRPRFFAVAGGVIFSRFVGPDPS